MRRAGGASYRVRVDILNDFITQSVASPWLYLILFCAAVLDGFFPPVPSETVLIAAAAVAASTGGVNVILLCAAGALGAMVGDNIAFAVGAGVGTRRFGWVRRPRVAAAFARAQRALRRGGAGLILGARYVPVGRVAVNMSAGALGYPRRRFIPLSVVGGVTWAVYSAGIGMLAGHWLQDDPVLSVLIGISIALLLGFVVDRVSAARRRARITADTAADTATGTGIVDRVHTATTALEGMRG